MNTDTLLEEIDATLESLDKLITPVDGEVGEYAKRKANASFMDAKTKAVRQIEKVKADGSDAHRTMIAESSKAYSDHLWQLAEAEGRAYQVTATKDLLEAKLDVLRSKLSFSKSQIERTT